MNIVVVLVTYNRIHDLKKCLACYSEQTILPDSIIVVNNASSDGTKDYLDKWNEKKEPFNKIVIHSTDNLGGAGGFALGIKEAILLKCDYIFIADDDAFPEKNMFELLIQKIKDDKSSFHNNNPVAYCTSVINNGKIDTMHRRKLFRKFGFIIKDVPIGVIEYKKDCFELDYLTFVGALIDRKVIEKIGLPCSEYFIREDDSEFSLRLGTCGKIICVPESKMYHNTGTASKLWLDYYTIRNNLHNVNKYFGKPYYLYSKTIWYIKRCSFLAKILKGRSDKYREMCKQAIQDADNGVFGFNELYSSKTVL